MVFVAAAFRPRFRRGAAEAEPTPVDDDPEGAGGSTAATSGANLGEEAEAAAGEEGADDQGEWLAYELHEWSRESRMMLQQLLTVDRVVHSWQGTTLLVHESLEEQVDSLVDEVEETEKSKEAISRPIGPEDELTAFELAEWPEALRAELLERLEQARGPHILDTSDVGDDSAPAADVADGAVASVDDAGAGVCDLLVRETDEERVELVIDDLLAREEESTYEELDGLEVNELLSRLFVACDRLRRHPGDPEGVSGVMTNVPQIAQVRTPFGFSAPNWRDLRNTASELLDLVESEDSDLEDLRESAHRLSDTLRMLV